MFERALALSGTRPADAVMVGDSYAADIVGAKRVGLRAIWVTPRAEPPSGSAEHPDAMIGSLRELSAVLNHWMSV
ncbi:MAG: HAD family hydrolase [Elusimicrobia bacterium]|nr:HAD family hydrolase [Elusimicrobiota bacterium]